MIAMEEAAGGHVQLARLERSDGEALRRLFFRLSPETLYRRFHSPIVRPEQAQPDRLLDIDHHDRVAVVAVLDDEIVGVARYARWAGTDSAEAAVVVADDWQGQGLATRMCLALSELAATEDVRLFTLNMQSDNRAVLQLVRRLYPDARLSYSQGMSEAVVALGSAERWA